MMLRVTTPFGLKTVVQKLAGASASPYRLACAAIDVAYHAERDYPGVVTRAKAEAAGTTAAGVGAGAGLAAEPASGRAGVVSVSSRSLPAC